MFCILPPSFKKGKTKQTVIIEVYNFKLKGKQVN